METPVEKNLSDPVEGYWPKAEDADCTEKAEKDKGMQAAYEDWTIKEANRRRGSSPTESGNPPKSPCLLKSVRELTGRLGDIESQISSLNSILFGDGRDREDLDTLPVPRSIEDSIHSACSRLAYITGSLSTINGRLDDSPKATQSGSPLR